MMVREILVDGLKAKMKMQRPSEYIILQYYEQAGTVMSSTLRKFPILVNKNKTANYKRNRNIQSMTISIRISRGYHAYQQISSKTKQSKGVDRNPKESTTTTAHAGGSTFSWYILVVLIPRLQEFNASTMVNERDEGKVLRVVLTQNRVGRLIQVDLECLAKGWDRGVLQSQPYLGILYAQVTRMEDEMDG